MTKWFELPEGLTWWDAPEELLPNEGETVIIKWKDGKEGLGYMVWSSTYKFIVLDDDFELIDYTDGVVAWRTA